jgi:hypothetical protein
MTVAPANTSSIIIAVTGVVQDPSTYSVSGTTLTFSAAPPSGTSNISVRYLGIPASGVTTTAYRTVTDFTATAGQTSFSTPSYTVGYIDVYRNGVRLVSTDFTATTGTTVVLANACTVGDAVVTESFLVSSVLNAIPATAGSVSDSYIVDVSASKLTGSRTIPKATMPAGALLQVVQAETSTNTSTTSTSFVTTNLTASITPSSSSSKVLVTVSAEGYINGTATSGIYTVFRGTVAGTNLGNATWGFVNLYGAAGAITGSVSINYLDSPSTTSSQTYTYAMRSEAGSATHINANGQKSTITLMEIAA